MLILSLTILFRVSYPFPQSAPCENRAMMMAAPTIVYPQQATVVQPDEHPLEKARSLIHFQFILFFRDE